jgi:hypothetical protein
MLIAVVAQYILFVVLACAAVVWLALGQRQRLAMLIALALAVVVGAGLLLASAVAWYDPRPFVVEARSRCFRTRRTTASRPTTPSPRPWSPAW